MSYLCYPSVRVFDMSVCSERSCYYCHTQCECECECGLYYCGEEHRRIHRPGKYCLPFKVSIYIYKNCLLFIAYCLLVIYCLWLSIVSYLLSVVVYYLLLFIVYCLFSVVVCCYLLSVVN